MHKRCPHITAGFGIVFLGMGILCAWYAFPTIAETAVQKETALKPDSKAWKNWERLPVTMKFQIYFFNVTNSDEVQNGAAPILKELGPYIYDLQREKVDIQVSELNDTIEYYEMKHYKFNEEASGCRTQEDFVTIVNPVLIGTALKVERIMPAALESMSEALPFLFPGIRDIFLRARVRDILFDGTLLSCSSPEIDYVCGTLKNMLPATVRKHPNDKDYLFSLFHHMNGTKEGPYVIQMGNAPNTSKGAINYWHGFKMQTIWYGDTCNIINGTDGGIFPRVGPTVKRIYVFSPDFCRSMHIDKEGEEMYRGLRTYRFSTPRTIFAKIKENECFCPRIKNLDEEIETVCTPRGTLDINPCIKAPMTVSFPHFYMGDEKLVRYCKGLKPIKKKHETFMNMDPLTGTPLRGHKRIQMNAYVKNYREVGFELMSNVSEGIIPFVWLDEGVELPDRLLNLVKEGHMGLKMLSIIKWFMILLGLVLMLSALSMIMQRDQLLCFSKKGSAKISQLPFSGGHNNRPAIATVAHAVNSKKGFPARRNLGVANDTLMKGDFKFNTNVNYPGPGVYEYSQRIVNENGINPNLVRRQHGPHGPQNNMFDGGQTTWSFQN